MAEQYKRLYYFKEDSFFEGAPLILEAGALLDDIKNHRILVQLKMQNVARTNIKAVTVRLELYNSLGETVGSMLHEYLDLDVKYGESFAQQEAIHVEFANARRFEVFVEKVVFKDESVWSSNNVPKIKLPELEELSDRFQNQEMLQMYHECVGERAIYVPIQMSGVWRCSCGAYNHLSESKCNVCEKEIKEQIEALEIDRLYLNHKEKVYIEACELLEQGKSEEDFQKACQVFESISDYKDAKEGVAKCDALLTEFREQEEQRNKKNKVIAAISVLLIVVLVVAVVILSPIIRYNQALSQIESKQYVTAYNTLVDLDYKDSAEIAQSIETDALAQKAVNAKRGETVYYGNYNGKQLAWTVLYNEENCVMLICNEIIAEKEYHSSFEAVTWEDCSLRKWLNSTFYSTAFTEKEQSYIGTLTLSHGSSPTYGTSGGNKTEDHVILLPISTYEDCKYIIEDTDFWWLCSPITKREINGRVHYYGAVVSPSGEVKEGIVASDLTEGPSGVRPAIVICNIEE